MPSFTQFFSAVLSSIADFLLTEPISWFVGLMVLVFVARLFFFVFDRGR